MTEWQDMQKQPNTKLRGLLKRNKAKTSKLNELSKIEKNRLAKLNAMLETRGIVKAEKGCVPSLRVFRLG